jgi:hypothetical protein
MAESMIAESMIEVNEGNCIFLTDQQAANKDLYSGMINKVQELNLGPNEMSKALELLPVLKNNDDI